MPDDDKFRTHGLPHPDDLDSAVSPAPSAERKLDATQVRDLSSAVGMNAHQPHLGQWTPPSQFGPFRLLKQLGAGGMGLVYAAEDTALQRTVALKLIQPHSLHDPETRARFLREARATAKLQSENVVTIHQVGTIDEIPFLAMELLPGQPLDNRLVDGQLLPIPEALRIAAQVARGLAAAHAVGLLHRDIKPANIWLLPTGRVKVLDFGLARTQAVEQKLTATGLVAGTPAYMAPEQANNEPLDFRCDLFSLGVVLYQMLAGRLPFNGNSILELLTALVVEEPPPLRQLRPELSRELAHLVQRLLAKKPSQRPASAEEVAAFLERALQRANATDVVPALARPTTARGRWLVLTVLVLAGAPLVGGALWLAMLEPPRPPVTPTVVPPLQSAPEPTVTPEAELAALPQRLAAANPGYVGQLEPIQVEGQLVGLGLPAEGLTDLRPLGRLRWVRELNLERGNLTDLSGLRGLRLEKLSLCYNPGLRDLSPLADMPIAELNLYATDIIDLTPLSQLPLRHLTLGGRAQLVDLRPLRKLPLDRLSINNTGVVDLTPLSELPLTHLGVQQNPVRDLRPIQGLKLTDLRFSGTHVDSLEPLLNMPLTFLEIGNAPIRDWRPLAKLTTVTNLILDYQPAVHQNLLLPLRPQLKEINSQPAEQLLGR
jgi:hypothetical protein